MQRITPWIQSQENRNLKLFPSLSWDAKQKSKQNHSSGKLQPKDFQGGKRPTDDKLKVKNLNICEDAIYHKQEPEETSNRTISTSKYRS